MAERCFLPRRHASPAKNVESFSRAAQVSPSQPDTRQGAREEGAFGAATRVSIQLNLYGSVFSMHFQAILLEVRSTGAHRVLS